jgi:hypothetical protein
MIHEVVIMILMNLFSRNRLYNPFGYLIYVFLMMIQLHLISNVNQQKSIVMVWLLGHVVVYLQFPLLLI